MGTAQAGLGAAAANPSSYISAMGGGKAALQAAGMAAAPALMMQPEQQTEEDQGELPGYDYAANPTGNFFGSDGDNSTRQRQYFNPTFTRRMAEGGETDAAAGMSGASADALRYLMGQTSASNMPAMQQGIAQGVQQPTAPATPADPSKQYMYDTATNSVIRNPGYVDPAAAAAVTASRSQNFSQPDYYYQAAQGGLLPLAKGGMASGGFVVPADVVAMVGEGNTDAGYRGIRTLVPEAVAIKGRDGGQADTVKTSIDGKQPARVAHGEMYLPPEAVKRMGGAQKLYAMMDRVRAQATGSTKQMKPVSLKRAMS
jgi:type II secretory pathway pseudopilin PulG